MKAKRGQRFALGLVVAITAGFWLIYLAVDAMYWRSLDGGSLAAPALATRTINADLSIFEIVGTRIVDAFSEPKSTSFSPAGAKSADQTATQDLTWWLPITGGTRPPQVGPTSTSIFAPIATRTQTGTAIPLASRTMTAGPTASVMGPTATASLIPSTTAYPSPTSPTSTEPVAPTAIPPSPTDVWPTATTGSTSTPEPLATPVDTNTAKPSPTPKPTNTPRPTNTLKPNQTPETEVPPPTDVPPPPPEASPTSSEPAQGVSLMMDDNVRTGITGDLQRGALKQLLGRIDDWLAALSAALAR